MGVCGLAAAWIALARQPAPKTGTLPPLLDEIQGKETARNLPPFLDDFLADTEPKIAAEAVRFPSVLGPVEGYWARPEVKERLPAVLIVYDDDAWTAWMRENTRHLASVGYGVLTVKLKQRPPSPPGRGAGGEGAPFADEAALARMAAAQRWLRGRADVLPGHLGVIGFGSSGRPALDFAAATAVQACVICDADLPADTGTLIGLRETPLLAVLGETDRRAERWPAFVKALAAGPVTPMRHLAKGVPAAFTLHAGRNAEADEAADQTWAAIYQFLEKHVEDARPAPVAGREAIASIADMMRAVNEPAGLRGTLGKALAVEPKSQKEWQRIRGHAALIAEAGVWLGRQPPPKGPVGHWKSQADAFAAAAETIAHAADRRDYPAAQRGLANLAGQCAACHTEHR